MFLRAMVVALAVAALHSIAVADAVRTVDPAGRVLDWTSGQLTARGLGVADRHAPSPAVARDAARRRAIVDASRALREAAKAIPMASGQRLGELLSDTKLAAAAAEATVVSAEPLVDGSWRMELSLPLETLRLAVVGPRPVPSGDDVGVPVVIVRVPASTKPVLGLAISDGKSTWNAPTLWAKGTSAAVPLPAGVLTHAPTVTAVRTGAAGVRVPNLPASALASDATLFVVVLGQAP